MASLPAPLALSTPPMAAASPSLPLTTITSLSAIGTSHCRPGRQRQVLKNVVCFFVLFCMIYASAAAHFVFFFSLRHLLHSLTSSSSSCRLHPPPPPPPPPPRFAPAQPPPPSPRTPAVTTAAVPRWKTVKDGEMHCRNSFVSEREAARTTTSTVETQRKAEEDLQPARRLCQYRVGTKEMTDHV